MGTDQLPENGGVPHADDQEHPVSGLGNPRQIGEVKVDMKKLVAWKQSVCDRMAGGVEQLLKGNSVTILRGEASFKTSTELNVKTATATESIQSKYFILANGSRPIQIPGFDIDEKTVLSSTGALALSEIDQAL